MSIHGNRALYTKQEAELIDDPKDAEYVAYREKEPREKEIFERNVKCLIGEVQDEIARLGKKYTTTTPDYEKIGDKSRFACYLAKKYTRQEICAALAAWGSEKLPLGREIINEALSIAQTKETEQPEATPQE